MPSEHLHRWIAEENVQRYKRLIGLHPVLKTPSLVFLLNLEVGHGATEVYARVQA